MKAIVGAMSVPLANSRAVASLIRSARGLFAGYWYEYEEPVEGEHFPEVVLDDTVRAANYSLDQGGTYARIDAPIS